MADPDLDILKPPFLQAKWCAFKTNYNLLNLKTSGSPSRRLQSLFTESRIYIHINFITKQCRSPKEIQLPKADLVNHSSHMDGVTIAIRRPQAKKPSPGARASTLGPKSCGGYG